MKLFIVVFILLISQISFTQEMCASLILNKQSQKNATDIDLVKLTSDQVNPKPLIFKNTNLHFFKFDKLEGDFRNFKSLKDSDFQKVLDMYLNTLFISANQKESIEKGELRLAHKIPNLNGSFEYIYKGDKRFKEIRFVLADIIFIKENASEFKLTKTALTDDATELSFSGAVLNERSGKSSKKINVLDAEGAKKLFIVDSNQVELNQAAQKSFESPENYFKQIKEHLELEDAQKIDRFLENTQTFKVPLVIEAQFANKLVKAIELFENLDREDVRIMLNNSQFNLLRVKAKFADLKSEVLNMGQKQILKSIFYTSIPTAILMYLINLNSEEIEKKIDHNTEIQSLDQLKNPITPAHLNLIVDKLLDESEQGTLIEKQSVIVVDKKTKKLTQKKHQEVLADLVEKEVTLAGEVEHIEINLNNGSTKPVKMSELYKYKSKQSSSVVASLFKKQRKMLISVIEFEKNESQIAGVDHISFTSIGAEKYPLSYAKAYSIIRSQIETSEPENLQRTEADVATNNHFKEQKMTPAKIIVVEPD